MSDLNRTVSAGAGTGAGTEEEFCGVLPAEVEAVFYWVIVGNGAVGFVVNLLIVLGYCCYKSSHVLSITEHFIKLLALSDLSFSCFVVLVAALFHALSHSLLNSCLFIRTLAFLHAFCQFLSWLLYINVTIERYFSICKVSLT